MNKKHIILAITKPWFKMKLYVRSGVKDKIYLLNQTFFSMIRKKKKQKL